MPRIKTFRRFSYSAFQYLSFAAFTAAMFYAPWAYGATSPSTIRGLNLLLGLACAVYLGGSVIGTRWPKITTVWWTAALALLAIGWWMTLNARAIYDQDYATFVPRVMIAPNLTGSADYALSLAMMIRVSLLFGVLLMVADATRHPRVLLALWWILAAVGTSISLLGLAQKTSGAANIFWANGPTAGKTFFASYFYHANAGAFLNLTWPFTIALAWRVSSRAAHPALRAATIGAAVISLVAVLANTSRMAQIVAAVILIALGWRFWPRVRRAFPHASARLWIGGAAFTIAMMAAIAYASQWTQALARWQLPGEEIGGGQGRWAAAEAGWRVSQLAGWFGFGPGAFRQIFPTYQAPLEGKWRFLHQDYLQTIIEWGWVGAMAWATIFFGGIATAWIRLRGEGRLWLPRERYLTEVAIIALLGVALHATVDFPLQIASIQLYAAILLGLCWRKL